MHFFLKGNIAEMNLSEFAKSNNLPFTVILKVSINYKAYLCCILSVYIYNEDN